MHDWNVASIRHLVIYQSDSLTKLDERLRNCQNVGVKKRRRNHEKGVRSTITSFILIQLFTAVE